VSAIHLTEPARRAIQDALQASGETCLRITISPTFDHALAIDGRAPSDIVVEDAGVVLLLDPDSAARAEGLTIDFADRPEGESGFVIDNPMQPRVKDISAVALKAVIEAGGQLVLMDARTPEERAVAMIAGSRLLDEEGYEFLMGLDRTTPVVFQCHHGVRSLAAAEHCLREGFTNVFNLTGGIEAWSINVDPSVPRY
jgi:monothiol glutaredoxin